MSEPTWTAEVCSVQTEASGLIWASQLETMLNSGVSCCLLWRLTCCRMFLSLFMSIGSDDDVPAQPCGIKELMCVLTVIRGGSQSAGWLQSEGAAFKTQSASSLADIVTSKRFSLLFFFSSEPSWAQRPAGPELRELSARLAPSFELLRSVCVWWRLFNSV